MPIKWSPGCGCCGGVQGCGEFQLGFTPSSPLSRGEYSNLSYWQPFTEYLQGTRFLRQSLFPEPGTGRFRVRLYEAPQTLFSGSGWTMFEESRYTNVKVVDHIDRPEEWIPFGPGWPTDPIEIEEIVNEGILRTGMGYVSKDQVIDDSDSWQVFIDCRWRATGIADADLEFYQLDVDFFSDAVMEENDASVRSAIYTNATYLVNHIPPHSCSDVPATNAQFTAHYKGTIGRIELGEKSDYNWHYGNDLSNFDDVFSQTSFHPLPNYFISHSSQPTKGNIFNEIILTGGPIAGPLNAAHRPAHGENIFFRNEVYKVAEDGSYTEAGATFYCNAGDLIRVVDWQTVQSGKAGGVELIPVEAIELDQILTFKGMEVRNPDPAWTGGGKRIGVYANTTTEDVWEVKLYSANGSRVADTINPTCEVVASLEEPPCLLDHEVNMPRLIVTDADLQTATMQAHNIVTSSVNTTLGNVGYIRPDSPNFFFLVTTIDHGIDFYPSLSTPMHKIESQSVWHTGQILFYKRWQVQKVVARESLFGQIVQQYYTRHERISATYQLNRFEVRGFIGSETNIYARTDIAGQNYEWLQYNAGKLFGSNDPEIRYNTEQEAMAASYMSEVDVQTAADVWANIIAPPNEFYRSYCRCRIGNLSPVYDFSGNFLGYQYANNGIGPSGYNQNGAGFITVWAGTVLNDIVADDEFSCAAFAVQATTEEFNRGWSNAPDLQGNPFAGLTIVYSNP